MKKVDYFRQRYQSSIEQEMTTREVHEFPEPQPVNNMSVVEENIDSDLAEEVLPLLTSPPPPAFEEVELDVEGDPVSKSDEEEDEEDLEIIPCTPTPTSSSPSSPSYVTAPIFFISSIDAGTMMPPDVFHVTQTEAITAEPPLQENPPQPVAAPIDNLSGSPDVSQWIPPNVPSRSETSKMTVEQMYNLYMAMSYEELIWSALCGFPVQLQDPVIVSRILRKLIDGMAAQPRSIEEECQLWMSRLVKITTNQ